jgi:hypothetical protein
MPASSSPQARCRTVEARPGHGQFLLGADHDGMVGCTGCWQSAGTVLRHAYKEAATRNDAAQDWRLAAHHARAPARHCGAHSSRVQADVACA